MRICKHYLHQIPLLNINVLAIIYWFLFQMMSLSRFEKKKKNSLYKKRFDMEDITTITGKYFFFFFSFLHFTCTWFVFQICILLNLWLWRSLDLANKRQRNTILANISYKQWKIEVNQYSHTFILHNKFASICFNCAHLFNYKFVSK